MIVRIPQRTKTDCAICTVSMVMGPDYPYERVLGDSTRYKKTTDDGEFLSWWELYFQDEGFEATYCRFDGIYALDQYGGSIVGMLGMDMPHLKMMHIVAVDESGVVDPADNAPDHVSLANYVYSRKHDGVIFHDQWLAVRKKTRVPALDLFLHPQ
jgi:hypothetical protein